MDQTDDKSQEATPHRRQQAREEGQVAHSQDLEAAVVLLGGLLILLWAGNGLVEYLARATARHLGDSAWLEADVSRVVGLTHGHLFELAQVLLPILGLLLIVALASHLMQTGFLWVPEKIALDWSRLDPWQGLVRIFSMSNAVRLALGIAKMTCVASVAAFSLYSDRDLILGLAVQPAPVIAATLAQLVIWTSIRIVSALLVLALADFGYQWWQREHDLRMTPQEVREEMKNLQGDPQTIARRRQVQRQLVLNRLSSTVPKADVVVTNPTELAIAIQYDPLTMKAPVVIAKGAGVLAARIRKLAAENGIPILERKPLAQALYKEVDLNRPIPQALYAAVAEVLAYVYQLKGKKLPPRAAA